MNDRPKTSSFGGSNVFGVLLCVIVSFDGSMFCNFVADAASAFTLYVLEAPQAACAILEDDLLKALCGRN